MANAFSKSWPYVLWAAECPEFTAPGHLLLNSLSFTHFVEHLKCEDPHKRLFYQTECLRELGLSANSNVRLAACFTKALRCRATNQPQSRQPTPVQNLPCNVEALQSLGAWPSAVLGAGHEDQSVRLWPSCVRKLSRTGHASGANFRRRQPCCAFGSSRAAHIDEDRYTVRRRHLGKSVGRLDPRHVAIKARQCLRDKSAWGSFHLQRRGGVECRGVNMAHGRTVAWIPFA